MRFRLAVSVLMATLLVACESPTSPSPYVPQAGTPSPTPGPTPAPTPTPSSVPVNGTKYCFVNDLTESVISAKASITLVGGEVVEQVTDESACVTVPTGAVLNFVDSPGFRRLSDFPTIREDVPLPQGTFAMWPETGYLQHLEEVDETGGFVYSGFQSFSGRRPRSGLVTVALPGDLAAANTADANAYQAALNTILLDASGDTSNKILFTMSPGGSANIKIEVDPNLSPFEAVMVVTSHDSHGFTSGAVLKLKSLDVLVNSPGLVRHELIHYNEINHINDDPGRLMYRSPGDFATASEAEVIHIRMRFLRHIGFDARKG